MVAGASVLLVAWLLKFIPKKALKKIPFTTYVDEDKAEDVGDKTNQLASWALSLNEKKIDDKYLPDVSNKREAE